MLAEMNYQKWRTCEISGSHGGQYEVQSSGIYCHVVKSMLTDPSAIGLLPHLSSPIPLDSYITSYLFTLGSLIALMMEAARTFEMSVDINLTTLQYIPEGSELQWRTCYTTFSQNM
jgi:hypothetical protein